MLTIIARRWVQKTYGNTYHSVIVYTDGKEVGRENFRYGYGNAYMQTAHEILMKAGLFPSTGKQLSSGMSKDYYEFMQWVQSNPVIINCTDVARKCDL